MNRGVRSGHPGPGRPSHGPAFGGAGPHSRRPNHAGMAPRDDMFRDGEAEAHINPRAYLGGRHHGQDTRASLGGHRSARGYQSDSAEEEDELRGRADAHRRPDIPRESNRFGHHSARPSQRDDVGGPRQPGLGRSHGRPGPDNAPPSQRRGVRGPSLSGLADSHSLTADSARPGRPHPSSHRHGPGPRGREHVQDNERYGGSRRERGNRARDISEDSIGERQAGPPSASLGYHRTKVDVGSREQEGRFVPYTFRMLPSSGVEFLIKVFKVRTSKVKEWCDDNLIRADTRKGGRINIDPLLDRLPSKDRERWEEALSRRYNEPQIAKVTGLRPRHVLTSYESGFYAGQASMLQRMTGGHRSGGHR